MKNDCKIVQDLLPNYLEKVTSKETNEYIEEHMKKCKECSKIYNEMVQDLNITSLDTKREVDYMKKFKVKMNFLKAILSVIAIIVIIFIIITLYKYSIITKLYDLGKENEEITNYYYKEERSAYITESWRKDNIIKTVITHKQGDFSTILWMNKATNEQYVFNNQSKIYNKGEVVDNGLPENSIYSTVDTNQTIADPNHRFNHSIINRLKTIRDISITSKSYDGKNCYSIKSGISTEEIVDKDTGLVYLLKIEDQDIKYTYKFNIITDKEVLLPDLNEYKLSET